MCIYVCKRREKKKKTCTWTDTQIHECELVISSRNGTQIGGGNDDGNVGSYENCEKLDTILNWWVHVDNDEHSRSSQSRKHFHFIPRKLLYHSMYPPTDWKKVNDFQRQIHISLF